MPLEVHACKYKRPWSKKEIVERTKEYRRLYPEKNKKALKEKGKEEGPHAMATNEIHKWMESAWVPEADASTSSWERGDEVWVEGLGLYEKFQHLKNL